MDEMSTQLPENVDEIPNQLDWEELLLEIQTNPSDGDTEGRWRLYEAIYGVIQVGATQWLLARNLGEAQDGALAAVGIDKIFKELHKFEIPQDSPSGIGKAFKSWALVCCEREWAKRADLHKETATETEKLLSLKSIQDTEVEFDANSEVNHTPTRPEKERQLMRRILTEELEKLPPAMKSAILEMEEWKDIHKPNARGKQGVAEAIAKKYSYTQGAIRTRRSRLLEQIQTRFNQENI